MSRKKTSPAGRHGGSGRPSPANPSSRGSAPTVFSRLAPAKPSPVYSTYWRFAGERQAIFFRRLAGDRFPWSEDPILCKHRFTNAYRASDRVSQFLIRNVIYRGDRAPAELFFRIILFKLFNRIETWARLERAFGELRCSEFRLQMYSKVLEDALVAGERVYSGAYIMPTGRGDMAALRKHETHLRLLERMLRDNLALRIEAARSMREVFLMLRSYPTIGDFLGYQLAIDLNYSGLTSFSEMDFVIPGPGARDGLRKCFLDFGGLTEADLIRVVADRQDLEFRQRGIDFRSLWGRRLQLVDCQNLFCEVDKYARAAHPEVASRSGRVRIKRRFAPRPDGIGAHWYPPKWGLNDLIASQNAES